MKIKDRITATIAITLIVIIFITSLTFTQLFIVNNRNMQLEEILAKNRNLSLFVEDSFQDPDAALKYLKNTGYLENIEKIIEANILIADEKMNILIDSGKISQKDLHNILLIGRPLNILFTMPNFLRLGPQNDMGSLMLSKIGGRNYYVSIQEFTIGSSRFLSIFFKQQNDIVIPPLKYLFSLSLIFLIAGLISLITGILLGKTISGPILKLNKSVSRISNGDYSEKIRAASDDEIGILARNINLMKNKIQKSQQSLKEYTFILSHEIKNMITSISGYASGISEGVYSSKEEIVQALSIIKSKSKDLENITESLLMLSKIENRIIDVLKEEINIDEITDDIINLYEKELEENKLEIKKFYKLPQTLKLMSDRYLVQTVISNLINNAIKYSSAGSGITINLTADNESVVFSVSNIGEKISGSEKDKIFNMFYRSKQYDFKNIKGFGLGLAISKKISTVLGASLDFVSEENNNTFIFSIPLI